MHKRLRKIASPPNSNGINSCPTVIEVTDDAATAHEVTLSLNPGTPLSEDDVVLQGYKLEELDPQTRRRLHIPEGEGVIVMPKAIYLEGARRLMGIE
jgi:hypothetical protein